MLFNVKFKTLFLFFIMGSTLLFSASLSGKKFDVESGMVLFTVSGGGQLTSDINISIEGEGKLRFKDWGVVALIEENYDEVTTGAVSNIDKVQICEKLDDKQRFDVDFKTKKILERLMPKGNFQDYYLKDMVKTGEENIAGYTCDMWEGQGVKKCMYKGIPLLVEHYLLGVYYQKKAIEVKLNIKTTSSKCTLPDFPVEKFALFKTSIKTKSNQLPKEFSSVIVSVNRDMHKALKINKTSEDDMADHQKQLWLDKIGQNIFEKQKKFLPELLLAMKEARVCLQQAENWIDANTCVENVVRLKATLTKDRQNNIEQWKGKEKEDVLDTFDDNIVLLESKMKCIRSSKNLTDLSVCMK